MALNKDDEDFLYDIKYEYEQSLGGQRILHNNNSKSKLIKNPSRQSLNKRIDRQTRPD